MNNIDQILEKNYEQLDILKSELSNLKDIKNRIEVLIGSNDKLPIIFSELFDKINQVTNDFTNVLANSVNVFLEGNNDLLVKNNTDFSNKISEFSIEISRLIEIDYNALFKDLETKFLENSQTLISKELEKFEEKINNFQNKIDDLGKEITRLSRIDLKEINKNFDVVIEKQQKTTSDLLKVDTKLDSLASQNEVLKKELEFNRKIVFVLIFLTLMSIILCVIK